MKSDVVFTITYWGTTGTLTAPLRPPEVTDKIVKALCTLAEKGRLSDLKPGADLEAAARRELLEETGYSATKWRSLGFLYASPGVMDEKLHLFVAERLSPGAMALEADEIDIEQVKWVVLMVLFSQPGQESAYAQMEDLVFEERSDALH